MSENNGKTPYELEREKFPNVYGTIDGLCESLRIVRVTNFTVHDHDWDILKLAEKKLKQFQAKSGQIYNHKVED